MLEIQIKTERVKLDERAASLFYYGIRHSDSDWGKPVTIEPNVVVNFFGTLISTESLDELFKNTDDKYHNLSQKQRQLIYNNADSGEFIDGSLLLPGGIK